LVVVEMQAGTMVQEEVEEDLLLFVRGKTSSLPEVEVVEDKVYQVLGGPLPHTVTE
jgi:hypothetical protein